MATSADESRVTRRPGRTRECHPLLPASGAARVGPSESSAKLLSPGTAVLALAVVRVTQTSSAAAARRARAGSLPSSIHLSDAQLLWRVARLLRFSGSEPLHHGISHMV